MGFENCNFCCNLFDERVLREPYPQEIPLSFAPDCAHRKVCPGCLARMQGIRIEEEKIAAVLRAMDRF